MAVDVESIELCYRASDDGWKASDFHRKCDGNIGLIFLFHSTLEKKFGGKFILVIFSCFYNWLAKF